MSDPRADYLRRLDAALAGPGRVRRSLLREAADHLDDATDALVAAGHEPAAAARRAVADFGSVAEVAPAFQTTIAVSSSRRTAWLLLAVVGCQPFLWDGGLRLAERNHQVAPDTWVFPLLDDAIEIGGMLVLLGAVLALVTTGLGHRYVRVGRAAARATAIFALGAAATVLGLCAVLTTLAGGTPVYWAEITALLGLPLLVVARSARATLAAT